MVHELILKRSRSAIYTIWLIEISVSFEYAILLEESQRETNMEDAVLAGLIAANKKKKSFLKLKAMKNDTTSKDPIEIIESATGDSISSISSTNQLIDNSNSNDNIGVTKRNDIIINEEKIKEISDHCSWLEILSGDMNTTEDGGVQCNKDFGTVVSRLFSRNSGKFYYETIVTTGGLVQVL